MVENLKAQLFKKIDSFAHQNFYLRMMKSYEILNRLKEEMPLMKSRFGVEEIGLWARMPAMIKAKMQILIYWSNSEIPN